MTVYRPSEAAPAQEGTTQTASATRGDWTTASLPVAVRAEAARSMLSAVHLPWELTLRDRSAYALKMAWTALGGCTLIECRSAPLAGSRGHREIGRTEGEHIALLLVLAGSERVRQGEASETLGPGDMILWDGSRPIDFEVSRSLHKVTLLIPRGRLYRVLPGSDIRGTRRLDTRSGLGGLLAGHMAGLSRLARGIPAGDTPLAADIMVDLLARLLAPLEGPRHGGSLIERILERVEARLDDPALTPTSLARELGITPRYLHMAFSATGGTLAAHIRARRLERVRRDLADPRLSHLSITDIVLRWGFNDPAHASRTFHKAYGMPPSRFRIAAGGAI